MPNGEVGGGVKYLHYGDIHTSEQVYLDPTATALPTLAKDHARRLDRLSEGDLVFVDASEDIGGVGKSIEIMGSEGHQLVSGLHTIAVRFNKAVLSDGFKAYLQFCPGFRNHLRRLATGTKVYATNRVHITTAELRVPPLPEQRAIAAVLGDVDALIGSLEALITKKRAIKQAAMQQLLTGRTRLLGFEREWQTRRLGNHLRFLRHGSFPRSYLVPNGEVGGGVKYLHYGDIHTSEQVYLDPTATALPTLAKDHARRLDRLSEGDLVFVDASEDIGGVGKSIEIMGSEGHQLVSGLHTIAVRFNKAVLADGFKAYLQFCPGFRDHLRRLAAGTKVYATNRVHIATAELRVPPLPEQRAIAAVLTDMDSEIAALGRRLAKTQALKQGMMQQLLTGSIRLPIPDAVTENGSDQ